MIVFKQIEQIRSRAVGEENWFKTSEILWEHKYFLIAGFVRERNNFKRLKVLKTVPSSQKNSRYYLNTECGTDLIQINDRI